MPERLPDPAPKADEVVVRSEPDAQASGMPRWVKVSLIVVLALAVLLAIAQFTGVGGDHGPGRHGGGGDSPTSVIEDDGRHTPPVDHRP